MKRLGLAFINLLYVILLQGQVVSGDNKKTESKIINYALESGIGFTDAWWKEGDVDGGKLLLSKPLYFLGGKIKVKPKWLKFGKGNKNKNFVINQGLRFYHYKFYDWSGADYSNYTYNQLRIHTLIETNTKLSMGFGGSLFYNLDTKIEGASPVYGLSSESVTFSKVNYSPIIKLGYNFEWLTISVEPIFFTKPIFTALQPNFGPDFPSSGRIETWKAWGLSVCLSYNFS